jgi:transposase InsO family protein
MAAKQAAEPAGGATNALQEAYCRPGGYWRGQAAVKKLAAAAKVPEAAARDFLKRQAVWQIYLPAPRHIPRPMFDEDSPNAVHQADLLYLPHDRVGRKTYKYALTVVDVASRYKEAEALTDKSAAGVAAALARIYKRGPLTWPRLVQVDPGREFMGAVYKLLAQHNVLVRRGRVENHRDQGIVERFNRTLAERLFGAQYAQELLLAARSSSERSREWVRALPDVVAAINDEPTFDGKETLCGYTGSGGCA